MLEAEAKAKGRRGKEIYLGSNKWRAEYAALTGGGGGMHDEGLGEKERLIRRDEREAREEKREEKKEVKEKGENEKEKGDARPYQFL